MFLENYRQRYYFDQQPQLTIYVMENEKKGYCN